MDLDDLKLLPGTKMKLVVAGGASQSPLSCAYIGSHLRRTIIVGLPDRFDHSGTRVGAKVAVSLASPTGIVTFSSHIQVLHLEPFAYVHLGYPDMLQVRNVRSAVRVGVEVTAQVANLYAEYHLEMKEACILDISVGGMKLGASSVLGNIGDELAINVQLTLDDIVRETMLTGIIRTSSPALPGADFPHTYGIELTMLDDDKRVLLYAFVFNMVQRHGPQI